MFFLPFPINFELFLPPQRKNCNIICIFAENSTATINSQLTTINCQLMNKPLTVYKASAGSGKTFQLALEYIKLLVDDPSAYSHILAVTFTNKATEEMKMRILTQLYGISHGCSDGDTKDYIDIIMRDMNVTENFVRERAKIALRNLLHNYSYFRVETIDSFFQSVLRNLARELDLTANLRIELNDIQIEQQAVSNLIESLDEQSNELNWIISYIRENIDEDKSWNIIGRIEDFGENIFKDIYKQNSEIITQKLHEKGFFQSYTQRLRSIRDDAEANMRQYADLFYKKLTEQGIDISDFSNGERGVAGYFKKLANRTYNDDKLLTATLRNALDDPKKWLKKADQDPASPLYQAVIEIFHPILVNSESSRPQNYRLYQSADLTLRHLNQLRLLNSIDEHVKKLNKQSNRFLLSDTQGILNALIGDDDSPFIYEKIGTQLKHIMIDEFQDTSTIQWKNFKVLLKECMSHQGASNLIVGDVKQSIYRWRSGDWRLLNGIESEFNAEQIETIPKTENFRSSKNVIDFNNAFFEVAKSIEIAAIAEENPDGSEELKRAYDDVRQMQPEKTRSKNKGLVRVELLPSQEYQEQTLQRLKEAIEELLSHQIPEKEIAVLVRSNSTIQLIADYLMAELPGVRLLSDEAFRLDASLAVNVLVEAMRLLVEPENEIVTAYLAKTYQKDILGNAIDDCQLNAEQLPTAFSERMETLRAMPVYELAEQLYSIFQLEKISDQSAYLCAFYDQLSKFLSDNMADLATFLEAWDENLHKKTVQGDGVEGIRLLTIHKSKGLEFDNVLLPFCDWKLEQSTLIWCQAEADAAPFNELPLIPIDYNANKMRGTFFENDYLHEHLQNTVDNLNLLYVAFTRAINNLFIFGRKTGKDRRSQIIGDSMEGTAKILENLADSGGKTSDSGQKSGEKTTEKVPLFFQNDGETIVFEYGQLTESRESDRKSDNVFRKKSQPINIEITPFDSRAEFRQSNLSRQFIEQQTEAENEPSDAPETKPEKPSYIQLGRVLHELFSTIRTTDDIPEALRRFEAEGILYNDEISREKLMKMLEKRLSDKRVSNWFSSSWNIFNECSILYIDPNDQQVKSKRPDRVLTDGNEVVVIDFKFGAPKPEYEQQVTEYMELLTRMGHPRVKGFLWYVYSNQIIEINGK